jgi:chromate transporter
MIHLFFLYIEFFKIGVFAVGGGLATLPFLFHMTNDHFAFIQRNGWLSAEQIGNFLAIAQCSPGAVGINVAAQTGFVYGGAGGGILAVMGLISPAIIVISVITKILQSLKKNKITESVFSGLRPAATGLLSAAGLNVWRLAMYNPDSTIWYQMIRWREGLVCLAIFLLIVKFKSHPIIYISLGAVAGVLLYL